jgi:hypothetical protein
MFPADHSIVSRRIPMLDHGEEPVFPSPETEPS